LIGNEFDELKALEQIGINYERGQAIVVALSILSRCRVHVDDCDNDDDDDDDDDDDRKIQSASLTCFCEMI
jgi:hypothetical protein